VWCGVAGMVYWCAVSCMAHMHMMHVVRGMVFRKRNRCIAFGLSCSPKKPLTQSGFKPQAVQQ
jgi:hypothetical protein